MYATMVKIFSMCRQCMVFK